MVQAWNSNAWAIQAEKSEVQGHSQLHSKFEAVLSNPISPQGPGHRHLGESLSRITLASLKLLVSHPRYLSLILIPKHLMFP